MEPTNTLPPVTEQVKLYLETKFKILKYESIDKASNLIVEVITDVINVLMLLLTFVFLNIVLVLFAVKYMHSVWEGFGCLTLLYAIITLSTGLFRPRLQSIFIRKFTRKSFRKRNL